MTVPTGIEPFAKYMEGIVIVEKRTFILTEKDSKAASKDITKAQSVKKCQEKSEIIPIEDDLVEYKGFVEPKTTQIVNGRIVKPHAVGVRKPKNTKACGTKTRSPNPDGLYISLNREYMLFIKESLVCLMAKKNKEIIEVVGAINPYTRELFFTSTAEADPAIAGKIITKFSELTIGYSKIVEKTDYKYGTITQIEQEVGKKFREYIDNSHICPLAEKIILSNYYEYWYIHICTKSKADRMRNTYIKKMGKQYRNQIIDNYKLYYGTDIHRQAFRDIWDRYIAYDVIRKPLCEM